jgi:uncharacterized protein (TIGR04255 family)
MAFPEVERVIYGKNPLEKVICQLRFPPILKIEAAPPTEFQEKIRDRYPHYSVKNTAALPVEVPGDLGKLITLNFPASGTAHEFESRDRKWKVSLTKAFIALSCDSYTRWEDFKEHFHGSLTALEELYKPSFYERIGLRYRDVVRRSTLSINDVPWSELLQSWIIGVAGRHEVGVDVQEIAGVFLVRLPNDVGTVRVRHGIALDQESKERCYLIDADFFDESQTELSHALDKLDSLNRQSRYLFRWCITETLHRAMDPRPVAT